MLLSHSMVYFLILSKIHSSFLCFLSIVPLNRLLLPLHSLSFIFGVFFSPFIFFLIISSEGERDADVIATANEAVGFPAFSNRSFPGGRREREVRVEGNEFRGSGRIGYEVQLHADTTKCVIYLVLVRSQSQEARPHYSSLLFLFLISHIAIRVSSSLSPSSLSSSLSSPFLHNLRSLRRDMRYLSKKKEKSNDVTTSLILGFVLIYSNPCPALSSPVPLSNFPFISIAISFTLYIFI